MYFAGHSLTLQGIAKKSGGSEVESDNVKWLKCNSNTDNGTELVSGDDNPTFSDATLGEGTWYLKFVAEDKDFSDYDFAEPYISTMTVSLTTGIATPRFIGAEDGIRIDEDGSITFTVNDVSPLTGYWKVDENGASQEVTEQYGENKRFTVNASSLSRNTHIVYYYATDSSGKTYTAQTSILVDSGPKFTDGPKIDTTDTPFTLLGTGKAGELDYSIIKSTNGIINLTLSVTTNEPGLNSINWHSLSGGHDTDVSSFNRNFSVGSYSYLVTIEDRFGIATSTIFSFWVWDYQDCGDFGVKNSLISDGSATLFCSSDETDIKPLIRNTDSTSSNCGGLAFGIATPAVSVGGLFYDSSNVYTLSKSAGLTLKKWKASDLTEDEEYHPSIRGITAFGSFIIKNSKIYITDRSNLDANRVKLFYSDGAHYVDSAYSFKKPYGIAYSDSKLFVSDTDDGKIVTLDLEGNDEEQTVNVPSPLGIIYSSSTGRIYAASNDNNIYVIDSNTFEILYSFKIENGAQNLTVCGTGDMSDLYVSSPSNGKIVRVRSGFNW
jgi:outer membrane protein assembly factor BamB